MAKFEFGASLLPQDDPPVEQETHLLSFRTPSSQHKKLQPLNSQEKIYVISMIKASFLVSPADRILNVRDAREMQGSSGFGL